MTNNYIGKACCFKRVRLFLLELDTPGIHYDETRLEKVTCRA